MISVGTHLRCLLFHDSLICRMLLSDVKFALSICCGLYAQLSLTGSVYVPSILLSFKISLRDDVMFVVPLSTSCFCDKPGQQ